jgi:transposase
LIEACGADLLYLPPYSPEFNPIEQAWSKIKQLLHGAKKRTGEALQQATTEVLAAITADDAFKIIPCKKSPTDRYQA